MLDGRLSRSQCFIFTPNKMLLELVHVSILLDLHAHMLVNAQVLDMAALGYGAEGINGGLG
jgi:hypothetical protein